VVSGDDRKIGPASVVHPNSTAIRAPAIAFGAGGVAELPHQANFAASRIHVAGAPSHVVGVARNPLRLPAVLVIAILVPVIPVSAVLVIAVFIPEIPVPTDAEISPASVIYPDALVVRAPAVTFRASGFAVLRR
jgi:hypothetical protein